MINLFIPNLFASSSEIQNIINNNNSKNFIFTLNNTSYKFFRKKKNKNYNLIFIKKNFIDKLLLSFSTKFKYFFLKFIIDSIISKRLFSKIIIKIKKFNIGEIYVDSCSNDYHGNLIKLLHKKKFNLNFIYIHEHPNDIKNIIFSSFFYKKNLFNNIFFKFILTINKNFVKFAINKKNFYISRFTLNQILFISLFKINFAHNFKRVGYNFFKKIYCINDRICNYIKKNENLSKNSIIVVYKNIIRFTKKSFKYDILITTHPFTLTKQFKYFYEELLLYEKIILKLTAQNTLRVLLYIHPNHKSDEKKKIIYMCKKYLISYKMGGNLHQDLNQTKYCLTYFLSTVVETCRILKVPCLKYRFNHKDSYYNKNIKINMINIKNFKQLHYSGVYKYKLRYRYVLSKRLLDSKIY